MISRFDERCEQFHRDLVELVNETLQTEIDPGAVAAILLQSGARIGFDCGVDPRAVTINALHAISYCFSENLEEEIERNQSTEEGFLADEEYLDTSTVSEKFKYRH